MGWSTPLWLGCCLASGVLACSNGVADSPPWEGEGGVEAAPGDPSSADDDGGVVGTSSGGRGGSSGGASPAAIAAACQAAGQSICSRTSACSSFLFQLHEPDETTCAARYAMQCETQLSAPGANETPDFVQSCSSAMAAGSCADLFDGVLPSACKSPAPGSLAEGAACGESTQCQSLDCRKASGSYCGTCTTPAQSGQSCASADCAPGLTCMGDSVCRPLAAQGAACSTTQRCQYPLVCSGGTCATPGAVGATCSSTSSTCDSTAGLVCDPSSKKCVAAKLVESGYACGVVSGTPMTCSGGAICKFATSASPTGTCLAAASDGASCSATEGPGCEAPSYCSSGVCTAPNPGACK